MLCVLQQLAAELARQNDRPNLSFQGNLRPPALGGLHGLDDRDAEELARWRAEYAAEADASEE